MPNCVSISGGESSASSSEIATSSSWIERSCSPVSPVGIMSSVNSGTSSVGVLSASEVSTSSSSSPHSSGSPKARSTCWLTGSGAGSGSGSGAGGGEGRSSRSKSSGRPVSSSKRSSSTDAFGVDLPGSSKISPASTAVGVFVRNSSTGVGESSSTSSTRSSSSSISRHSTPVSSSRMSSPASLSRVLSSAALCDGEIAAGGVSDGISLVSGLSSGRPSSAGAAASGSCFVSERKASALNALPQPPQRTLPPAIFSTSAVTRNEIPQSGHWVYIAFRYLRLPLNRAQVWLPCDWYAGGSNATSAA